MKQVCIVGGAALDITGMPDGVCRLRDSNLGAVRVQVGGVGRNIACRLARYALRTELITALGNDVHAQMIEQDCASRGIGLTHSLWLDEPSAVYLCVLDEERDLLAGVNDSAEAMLALFRALQRARVRPYYVFQCDPVAGIAHFRVPLERARQIERACAARIGGLGLPRFVADLPDADRKTPISEL